MACRLCELGGCLLRFGHSERRICLLAFNECVAAGAINSPFAPLSLDWNARVVSTQRGGLAIAKSAPHP